MVEDNPGYVVYNRLMRMLYEFNPIRDQVAGSIESIAEITAETETVMAIITAYLNVSRRHRVVLTELSRSRKTPARETVRKMIEIIRLADTARVQKKK